MVYFEYWKRTWTKAIMEFEAFVGMLNRQGPMFDDGNMKQRWKKRLRSHIEPSECKSSSIQCQVIYSFQVHTKPYQLLSLAGRATFRAWASSVVVGDTSNGDDRCIELPDPPEIWPDDEAYYIKHGMMFTGEPSVCSTFHCAYSHLIRSSANKRFDMTQVKFDYQIALIKKMSEQQGCLRQMVEALKRTIRS